MNDKARINGPARPAPPLGKGRAASRLWAPVLALAMLTGGLFWAHYANQPEFCLAVREADTGEVLALYTAQPGQEFTLWFLHSYDRAFFAEHYRLEAPGRIMLTHMTFKSNLNGEGFEYHDFHLRADGVGELRNINEPRGKVDFRLGSPDMANHTLILSGERFPLCAVAMPGTLINLEAAQAPRWRLWWNIPGL